MPRQCREQLGHSINKLIGVIVATRDPVLLWVARAAAAGAATPSIDVVAATIAAVVYSVVVAAAGVATSSGDLVVATIVAVVSSVVVAAAGNAY